jgi:murein DD-endopeptidase MepM/ murein hydrolase activator NlpD
MRQLLVALALAAIGACAAADPAAPEAPASAAPAAAAPAPAPAAEAPAPAPAPTALSLRCAGALVQGGVALCRTLPGAQIFVDGTARGAADAQGWAVVGFDRFAEGDAHVEARADGRAVARALPIAARTFNIQRVDGLPPQTVTPTEPAILERIHRETAIKNTGFASRVDAEGWLDGFVIPVNGRISGRWGDQRIDNGVPKTPHYGYDIAAPDGTLIRAPASGVVSLAQPDMFFEGGLVFIDHGQGLITMYLHMSRVDVAVGDHVTQGQVIGAVGHAGRATGPHLCWRMKWRDRNLDPSVAIDALAAAKTELASAP